MSDNYFKTGLENLRKSMGLQAVTSSKISVILLLIWPAISLNLLLARFTNVPGSVCRNENC